MVTEQLPIQTDVLVVGAGPTGLTLALDLARRGVAHRLIDPDPGPAPWSKANSFLQRPLQVLDDLGLAERQIARGTFLRATDVSIYGSEPVPMVDQEGAAPYLLNIPQNATELTLTEGLVERGGRVERRTRLVDLEQDEDGVTARLVGPDGSARTCRARFVVGCDGAHSTVRKLLGLPLIGTTYAEPFVVADVRAEPPFPRDVARLQSTDDGFLLLSWFRHGDLWHVIASVRGDRVAPFRSADPAVAEEALRGLLRRHCGMEFDELVWLSVFRTHRRQVDRYRVGRVLLAGDAAHLHTPMAGNGLGNSMQDGYNLGWKLDLISRGVAGPDLLESYQPERMPAAEGVMRAGALTHGLLATHGRLARSLRRRVLRPLLGLLAGRTLPNPSDRVSDALGMNASYRTSPLTGADDGTGLPAGGPRAGEHYRDAAPLVLPDGRSGRWADVLRGTRFTLLVGAGAADPAALLRAARRHLGDDVRGVLAGRVEPGFDRVDDPDGRLAALYGTSGVHLFRPDGYLAHRDGTADPQRLAGHLARWFDGPAARPATDPGAVRPTAA